ncbi:uncharacterized protein LOC115442120 [Manduca sexta]|uniref:uncharacterized protein LOC115442120 n=1 Tax=Manduca sexta TaxID=7130 RepID=UPI00188EEBF7|nr:uncharacterized protein LOC115442120 [Manduca sexta]
MDITKCIVMAWIMFYCDAVTYREQLDHIAKRRRESRGMHPIPSRRQDTSQMSVLLGAPSMPSHLPEAEPILPGHTLIRPARGMLKSAVKYPHLELDNGAGVYGNVNNLGIRYDGRNERVQYSGFRRTPNNLIVAVPKFKYTEPRLSLSSFFELSDRSTEENYDAIRGAEIRRPKKMKGIIFKIQPTSEKSKNQQSKTYRNSRQKHRVSTQFLPETYNKHFFKKIRNKKPKKKRFRPPGARPLQSHLKSLDIDSLRRDRLSVEDGDRRPPVFIPDETSTSDDYVMATSEEKKKQVSKEVATSKMDWFWKSKDAYDNIKISLDAPDLTELMPAVSKDTLRQWWFYHQDDFVPFETLT